MMMKKSLNVFVVFLAAIFVLAGCSSLNKMVSDAANVSYKVNPEVLEMHAGEVPVSIDITFPANYFMQEAVVMVTPVLRYQGGERQLKTVAFQGEKVESNNVKVPYAEGLSYTYTDVIPYADVMRKSELFIQIKGQLKDKSVDFEAIKVADGIITTPELVVNEAVSQDDQGYNNSAAAAIPATYTQEGLNPVQSFLADIHFTIQNANIRSSETRADDMKEIKEKIKETAADEKQVVKGVSISAYASPDGPLDLNTELADKRAKSAEKYLAKEMKRSKVEEATQSGFYTAKTTAEDWEGFKKVVAESDIKDKDLLLRVLKSYSDPAVREKEIKNITQAYYSEFKEDVWPKLRRSVFELEVGIEPRTDAEIQELIKNDPSQLTADELLYAAEKLTSATDLEKRLVAYKTIENNYPNDWRGPNNSGYIYLLQGKTQEAKAAFEKAERLDPGNEIILNNLGVVALTQDNMNAAESYFNTATLVGNKAKRNMGIVNIQNGDYATAVSNFGSTCSFNAALAKLLNGDNSGANNTLACTKNATAAKHYYLRAVIGARMANDNMVFDNLKQAVAKDASLKDYAKKDLEFRAYFAQDAFLSIIQ